MWRIEFYETEADNAPVLEWIEGMPEDDQGLALWHMDQLARLGIEARAPLVKPLGSKLFELRWKASDKQHRIIYFAASSRTFVMLHGFIKKRQTTPRTYIGLAMRRMREYNQRNEG